MRSGLPGAFARTAKWKPKWYEVTSSHFGYTKDNAPPFYKGEGCDKCNHTGKKGRVGIFELLTMNDELKRGVASGAKTDEIRDLARKAGMKTLKEYAMMLMAEGLTSVDEVLTNLVSFQLVPSEFFAAHSPRLL